MSSPDFEPDRYADEYRERALAMIEKKVKGQEIKAVPTAPRAHRPGRRHLRGVKEASGKRRPAETHCRARQAQKEGIGTENQRPVFSARDGSCLSIELVNCNA